ncbi:MAG: hypothetical protein QOJ43_627 [Gaiellaceae bacterium]|jgi:hypothetical protein|nr:hypothetical protein [Gaiellaceae bacterium]
MSDETRDEELEEKEGAPLPPREMMSLLSTSPASGLGGLGDIQPGPGPVPTDPAQAPTTGPLPHVQPVSGDEMHTQDGADAASPDPRHETITQSDSAASET